MAGWIVATLDITDPEKFALYREQVVPLIAEFGGETVVNTEEITVREGSPTRTRVICVRFPRTQAAHAFLDCDAYQPMLRLRLEASEGEVVIVEGKA